MADKKINDAQQKSILSGSEELPLNDSGLDRKTTTNSIAELSVKEALSQQLLSDPAEPADNDRVLIGTSSNPFNIVWSRFKELIVAAVGNVFDFIQLNTDTGITLTAEGQIKWNDEYYTPEYDTGLGKVIKSGTEQYVVFYNNTGVQIDAGKALHLIGGDVVGGEIYPTFELADARTYEKIQGTLTVCMHDVANGALGLCALSSQKITGVDTSAIPAGSQLWVSADGSGSLTNVKPEFPNFSISVGGNYTQSSEGEIFVNFTSDFGDIYHEGWSGSILESFDFTISSDGINVIGTLANVDPARDLTLNFSDGPSTLDTTSSPLTIALTPGTDELQETNYVYIPKSTKLLTVSSGGWPLTEHAKIARCEIQSAASVQADNGGYRNQNINDHIKQEDDNGHILHIAERLRQFNAEWDNGTEATFDNTGGNGYIITTAGQAWQLHKQDVPESNMALGDIALIPNDFTTAYRRTTNLASITAYSDGSAWNNEWSKVVVIRLANKTGEPSFTLVNLPSNGYNSEANAIADASNYANFSIPDKYKGVGFLVASFVIRISGGVITYNGGSAYQDLRGFIPNNVAGGGGGGGGVTSFLGLTDTPSSYAGQAGKHLIVNPGESALEFADISAGAFQATINSIADLDTAIAGAVSGDWLIESDLTLDADKTIPAGVTLHFRNNSKITFGAFDLIGASTKLRAELNHIFDYNSTGELDGNWDILEIIPQWWGAVSDDITDCGDAINRMFSFVNLVDENYTIRFPAGNYYTSKELVLPKTSSTRFLYLNGYGATIRTDQSITVFNRRPVDQTEAVNIISNLVPVIKGFSIKGSYTVDSVGIYVGAAYSAVLEDLYIVGFETGIIGAFTLQSQYNNIRYAQCSKDNIVLATGRSDQDYGWPGGGLSTSASNASIIRNNRVFGEAGAESHYKILGSDLVSLENVISEGSNPIYSVYFDYQGSTTVKNFSIDRLHLESTGGTKTADIFYNGTGVFRCAAPYGQYSNKFIDANGVGPFIRLERYSWMSFADNSALISTVGLSGDPIFDIDYSWYLQINNLVGDGSVISSIPYNYRNTTNSSFNINGSLNVSNRILFTSDDVGTIGGVNGTSSNKFRPNLICVGSSGVSFSDRDDGIIDSNSRAIQFDKTNKRWKIGTTGAPFPYTPFMYLNEVDKSIETPWIGSDKALLNLDSNSKIQAKDIQPAINLANDVSATYTQAEVQDIADKLNSVINTLRNLGLIST